MRRLALLMILTCACAPPRAPDAPSPPSPPSNITRADYAGSKECGDCHRAIAAAFERSPMHRMTRRLAETTIRAPFDGAAFHFHGDQVVMTTDNHERIMRITTTTGERTYRVTKVIGGRYREDFVGRDITAATDEVILPVSWIYATSSWRYKGYSVQNPERPRLAVGPTWRQTCIFCHNTVPWLDQVFDDLIRPGTRGYQGSVADHFLPPDRLWRPMVTDSAALGRAVAAEVERQGSTVDTSAPLDTILGGAISATYRRFDETHLVELGIGCEACHLGARAHADDPQRKPSLLPQAPFLTLRPPDGHAPSRAEQINHACARCHTVLYSRYPYTWEGGHRDATAGGCTINSGEARDFLLGGCAAQLACTTCHDPHGEDSRETLTAMAGPTGNAICTHCHAGKEGPTHSHHTAETGCIACHMPKKNLGLGYELERYHRIGSPTDSARVERDRPLECALCHADKTVAELVTKMETWWGKRYDRAALTRLYGADLSVNVLAATLLRGLPHERAAAAGAIGLSGIPDKAKLLEPMLRDPYPLLRYLAAHSIGKLTGTPPTLDDEAAPTVPLKSGL